MKRKAFKRLLTLVLAGTMMAGCLTGCGDTKVDGDKTSESKVESTATSESKTSETQVVEEPAEPTKLTYYVNFTSDALNNLGEMESIQYMQEKANVELEFYHPSGDNAAEQFNLKIASGNWEDLVEYEWSKYPGGTTQAIEDGIIIDIAPYIEEYAPNFKAYLDEHPEFYKQLTDDKGRIYGFPCFGDPAVNVTSGLAVRQDWLDKLNMKTPETISDWEAMLTAFKDQPGATKPLGLNNSIFIKTNYFAGAWGIATTFYVDNGTVKYGYAEPAAKDFVATMADWYQKGLIDDEAFGTSDKIIRSNILNNLTGAAYGYVSGLIGTVNTSAAESNPECVLVGVPNPVLNRGEQNPYINKASSLRPAGSVAITAKCPKEKIEAAMRYLDQYYTEEGIMVRNFGIEGLTYEMVDGVPRYTELITKYEGGMSNALKRYTRASTPTVGIIDARYYDEYYTNDIERDSFKLWNAENTAADAFIYPASGNISVNYIPAAFYFSCRNLWYDSAVLFF